MPVHHGSENATQDCAGYCASGSSDAWNDRTCNRTDAGPDGSADGRPGHLMIISRIGCAAAKRDCGGGYRGECHSSHV